MKPPGQLFYREGLIVVGTPEVSLYSGMTFATEIIASFVALTSCIPYGTFHSLTDVSMNGLFFPFGLLCFLQDCEDAQKTKPSSVHVLPPSSQKAELINKGHLCLPTSVDYF